MYYKFKILLARVKISAPLFYFSCSNGVYACVVLIYSGGTREALCRIDETSKNGGW